EREAIAKESYHAQKKAKKKVIFGHQTFGWHKVVEGDATYVSFVREPKKRLQSLYKYIIMLDSHYLSDLIKDKPIKQFLSETKYLDFDNGMVRQFSGTGQEKPFGLIDGEDLNRAKKNIEKHFLFVGIQEKFEISLFFMSKLLGWKKKPYTVRENSSEKVVQALTSIDMEYVLSLNQYDVMLYDWIYARFEHDISQMHTQQVNTFLQSNKKYGKLLRLKFKLLRKLKRFANA
ncbi:MAG: hypothetical protein Q9M44_02055, partial [Ghiorsea sp.]|nr:hypothetical protein [Ghiorsea sp.]